MDYQYSMAPANGSGSESDDSHTLRDSDDDKFDRQPAQERSQYLRNPDTAAESSTAQQYAQTPMRAPQGSRYSTDGAESGQGLQQYPRQWSYAPAVLSSRENFSNPQYPNRLTPVRDYAEAPINYQNDPRRATRSLLQGQQTSTYASERIGDRNNLQDDLIGGSINSKFSSTEAKARHFARLAHDLTGTETLPGFNDPPAHRRVRKHTSSRSNNHDSSGSRGKRDKKRSKTATSGGADEDYDYYGDENEQPSGSQRKRGGGR